jgi:hypothetical protein
MNEAETYVTLNLAKQLTPNVQLRFDNLTNQKAVYTSANIPGQQEVRNSAAASTWACPSSCKLFFYRGFASGA